MKEVMWLWKMDIVTLWLLISWQIFSGSSPGSISIAKLLISSIQYKPASGWAISQTIYAFPSTGPFWIQIIFK